MHKLSLCSFDALRLRESDVSGESSLQATPGQPAKPQAAGGISSRQHTSTIFPTNMRKTFFILKPQRQQEQREQQRETQRGR